VKVTRWNRRLWAGAMVLLIPALAGCEAGLNAPTLEFHPAAYGVSVVNGDISIDNAFVLGPGLNGTLPAGGQAGLFLSLEDVNGDRLVSVTAPDNAKSVKITGGSLNLAAQSLVDLSGPAPKIVLTGLTTPLVGGETVRLVLTFANQNALTLSVPVMPRAYEYATYSPPAPTPTASPSASASTSASPGATASGSASASASATPTATP
jgi:copper(I)-binding protein